MRTVVSFVVLGVPVFFGRQQLAPQLSICSFGGGQVQRQTRRLAEAFKGAVKDVVHCVCSNCRHIQIMGVFFYENSLTKIWVTKILN